MLINDTFMTKKPNFGFSLWVFICQTTSADIQLEDGIEPYLNLTARYQLPVH